MLKILHIAVENFAGVPQSFVKMHRAMGDQSILVTFYRTAQNFPEELSLNFKIHRNFIAKAWRQFKVVRNIVSIEKKKKLILFILNQRIFLNLFSLISGKLLEEKKFTSSLNSINFMITI